LYFTFKFKIQNLSITTSGSLELTISVNFEGLAKSHKKFKGCGTLFVYKKTVTHLYKNILKTLSCGGAHKTSSGIMGPLTVDW